MPISVAGRRSARGLSAPLGALVRVTLRIEGRRAGEIAVVLTDDPEVRSLNRRWRRLDRATDVLSFGYDGGDGGGVSAGRRPVAAVDGDIVISMDRVGEQARRFRVTPGRELARLVVHGALHLAGRDHDRPAARRAMRVREAEALRAGRRAVAALERSLRRSTEAAGRAARKSG